MRRAVRITRHAISPRLAIRIFLNTIAPPAWGRGPERACESWRPTCPPLARPASGRAISGGLELVAQLHAQVAGDPPQRGAQDHEDRRRRPVLRIIDLPKKDVEPAQHEQRDSQHAGEFAIRHVCGSFDGARTTGEYA